MQKLKACVFWGALPVSSPRTPISYIFDQAMTQVEGGGFQIFQMVFKHFLHARLEAASLHFT